MIRVHCRASHLLALGFALMSAAHPVFAAEPPTGFWRGTYTCYQGLTALDLVLSFDPKGVLRGEFHFTPVSSNPAVPEGCFTMKGSFDSATRRVRLTPGRWLLQPDGYVMIGLDGRLDPSSDVLQGEISPPVPGCTSFLLHAAESTPPSPSACHPGATTVSLPLEHSR